jgi:hypothetical protein
MKEMQILKQARRQMIMDWGWLLAARTVRMAIPMRSEMNEQRLLSIPDIKINIVNDKSLEFQDPIQYSLDREHQWFPFFASR